jgi:hypothetical protein
MQASPYDQLLERMRTAQDAVKAQRDSAQQIAQQAAAARQAPAAPPASQGAAGGTG